MKKKYKVNYTWHSGECFGARTDKETIVEIEESDLDSWKYYFEELEIYIFQTNRHHLKDT